MPTVSKGGRSGSALLPSLAEGKAGTPASPRPLPAVLSQERSRLGTPPDSSTPFSPYSPGWLSGGTHSPITTGDPTDLYLILSSAPWTGSYYLWALFGVALSPWSQEDLLLAPKQHTFLTVVRGKKAFPESSDTYSEKL